MSYIPNSLTSITENWLNLFKTDREGLKKNVTARIAEVRERILKVVVFRSSDFEDNIRDCKIVANNLEDKRIKVFETLHFYAGLAAEKEAELLASKEKVSVVATQTVVASTTVVPQIPAPDLEAQAREQALKAKEEKIRLAKKHVLRPLDMDKPFYFGQLCTGFLHFDEAAIKQSLEQAAEVNDYKTLFEVAYKMFSYNVEMMRKVFSYVPKKEFEEIFEALKNRLCDESCFVNNPALIEIDCNMMCFICRAFPERRSEDVYVQMARLGTKIFSTPHHANIKAFLRELYAMNPGLAVKVAKEIGCNAEFFAGTHSASAFASPQMPYEKPLSDDEILALKVDDAIFKINFLSDHSRKQTLFQILLALNESNLDDVLKIVIQMPELIACLQSHDQKKLGQKLQDLIKELLIGDFSTFLGEKQSILTALQQHFKANLDEPFERIARRAHYELKNTFMRKFALERLTPPKSAILEEEFVLSDLKNKRDENKATAARADGKDEKEPEKPGTKPTAVKIDEASLKNEIFAKLVKAFLPETHENTRIELVKQIIAQVSEHNTFHILFDCVASRRVQEGVYILEQLPKETDAEILRIKKKLLAEVPFSDDVEIRRLMHILSFIYKVFPKKEADDQLVGVDQVSEPILQMRLPQLYEKVFEVQAFKDKKELDTCIDLFLLICDFKPQFRNVDILERCARLLFQIADKEKLELCLKKMGEKGEAFMKKLQASEKTHKESQVTVTSDVLDDLDVEEALAKALTLPTLLPQQRKKRDNLLLEVATRASSIPDVDTIFKAINGMFDFEKVKACLELVKEKEAFVTKINHLQACVDAAETPRHEKRLALNLLMKLINTTDQVRILGLAKQAQGLNMSDIVEFAKQFTDLSQLN